MKIEPETEAATAPEPPEPERAAVESESASAPTSGAETWLHAVPRATFLAAVLLGLLWLVRERESFTPRLAAFEGSIPAASLGLHAPAPTAKRPHPAQPAVPPAALSTARAPNVPRADAAHITAPLVDTGVLTPRTPPAERVRLPGEPMPWNRRTPWARVPAPRTARSAPSAPGARAEPRQPAADAQPDAPAPENRQALSAPRETLVAENTAAPPETRPAAATAALSATDSGRARDGATAAGASAAATDTTAPESAPTDRAAEPGASAGQTVDWTHREITGPVPRANIVLYPKHRVLLLRSHAQIVRTYRDIAAPSDLSAPKAKAGDRRSPAGMYTICARTDAAGGMVLRLDYPSLADADKARREERISEEALTEIRTAHAANREPPDDTPLGGPISITPDRERGEQTYGDFALTETDFQELWQATPPGTPVIIVW